MLYMKSFYSVQLLAIVSKQVNRRCIQSNQQKYHIFADGICSPPLTRFLSCTIICYMHIFLIYFINRGKVSEVSKSSKSIITLSLENT